MSYLHPGEVSASFSYCLARMLMYEGYRDVPPYILAQRVGSGRLIEGRNDAVKSFLATECEWLLFVDSDMGFGHDALEQLLAVADPVDAPVVGALCFGFRVGDAGHDDTLQAEYLEMFPTIYQFEERDTEVGFLAMANYPTNELVQCAGTGSAFILSHRSVYEAISAKHGDGVWYDQITHPKGPTTFSEDLSYCIRVAGVDRPLFVHTGVKTSHDKGAIFGTELNYQRQQAAKLLVGPDGRWRADLEQVRGLCQST